MGNWKEEHREALECLDVEPMGVFLLVDPKVMDKTEGGIIIPETTREMKAAEGTIVAVGEHVEYFKPGDKIIYGRYSGIIVERGPGSRKHQYHLMNHEDVLGINRGFGWVLQHTYQDEVESAMEDDRLLRGYKDLSRDYKKH